MINLARKVSIIGLGHAGLPLAVVFGKLQHVIAYDTDATRIKELKNAQDRNGMFDSSALRDTDVLYTSDPADLKKADFHIISAPTPVTIENEPDLKPLLQATETVGSFIKKGDLIVFQSTVYPGVTEEECIPLLERISGLKCGLDFTVGYSPERFNSGDTDHSIVNTKRVVAAQDAKSMAIIASVYGAIVKAELYQAPSIRVAEAAKLIENIQRDVNIALINEFATVLNKLNIDTQEVIETASSKWNFHQFWPGLVGGHCISIDPYYFIHMAVKAGCPIRLITESRKINDSMPDYLARQTISRLQALAVKTSAPAAFLGLTYKENCSDMRNSRACELFLELKKYGLSFVINDPVASQVEVKQRLALELIDLKCLPDVELLVVAVAHDQYKQLTAEAIIKQFPSLKLVVDIKSILDHHNLLASGIDVWRL